MNIENNFEESEDKKIVKLLALAVLSQAVTDVKYYLGDVHNEAVDFLNINDYGFLFWCKCAELNPKYFLSNMICKNNMEYSKVKGSPINRSEQPLRDKAKVYITKECELCGKEYQKYIHAPERRFCSTSCANKKVHKPGLYSKWKNS